MREEKEKVEVWVGQGRSWKRAKMGLFYSTSLQSDQRCRSTEAHRCFGTGNTKSRPDKHTPNKHNRR